MKLYLLILVFTLLTLHSITSKHFLSSKTKLPDNYKQADHVSLIKHDYYGSHIIYKPQTLIYRSKNLELHEKTKSKENKEEEVYRNTWSIGFCEAKDSSPIINYQASEFKMKDMKLNFLKKIAKGVRNLKICGSDYSLKKYRIPVIDLEIIEPSQEQLEANENIPITIKIKIKNPKGELLYEIKFQVDQELATKLYNMKRESLSYLGRGLISCYQNYKVALNQNDLDYFNTNTRKYCLSAYSLDDNLNNIRTRILNDFAVNLENGDQFLIFFKKITGRTADSTEHEHIKRIDELNAKNNLRHEQFKTYVYYTKKEYDQAIKKEQDKIQARKDKLEQLAKERENKKQNEEKLKQKEAIKTQKEYEKEEKRQRQEYENKKEMERIKKERLETEKFKQDMLKVAKTKKDHHLIRTRGFSDMK